MSAEAYASLLAGAGHRVIRTDSAWWYEAHPHWFQCLPMHTELQPTSAELAEVLNQEAWVLRYSCPVELGTASYLIGCADHTYDLSTLSSTARRATRRGLEHCSVRRLLFDELEAAGALELSRSTLERQDRKVTADHDRYWRGYFAAAHQAPIAECWGAFDGDQLAAFLLAVTVGDCLYLHLLKSSSEHLASYPNNAVVYTFVHDALGRPGIDEVSWGLESLLPEMEGLERFKRSMGFEQRPIGQRIELTRWLDVGVRGPATWAMPHVARLIKGNHAIDRAASTLRWHADQPTLPG